MKNFIRAILLFNIDIRALIKYFSLQKNEKYAFFQKYFYNRNSKGSSYKSALKKDELVGSYAEQNNWKDYDNFLIGKLPSLNLIALDFGTGPGRNIVKYNKLFKRIDGVDISEELIKKARENLKYHKIKIPKLYVNNGYDLKDIRRNTYDFIMSSITLQHICVYSTRLNLLNEFYRTLRPGGILSFQMGFGKNSPNTVGYYQDNYLALVTNRGCDTRVDSEKQIINDLRKIGYKKITTHIRPTGPGDYHPKWIFVKATK